jgi:hypothetical protein
MVIGAEKEGIVLFLDRKFPVGGDVMRLVAERFPDAAAALNEACPRKISEEP